MLLRLLRYICSRGKSYVSFNHVRLLTLGMYNYCETSRLAVGSQSDFFLPNLPFPLSFLALLWR